ncbi:Hypothetical protein GLP15_2517 [Giardia lamblia P15]|uniref:Uncharacterized protein n=1 Tax=Giardia intestinalis (strain P15) TaxID=658858 RepID=E1EXB3_GIAIA|nr:Hypothetical protein GLP15_2517 [Giardia lamblia P15]
MKCSARQRGKSARISTLSSTSNNTAGSGVRSESSENLNSVSGSSAIDALVHDMAALQTTLAVTTSQLNISSSQLQSKERELERVRGRLRDMENSVLNNSCVSIPCSHEASTTCEVLIEKIDSICNALGVKPISTAYEESRVSTDHHSSTSIASQAEPLLISQSAPASGSDAYIDDTISAILKVIEDKSMQINFLANSLDIINAQLIEERQLSRKLADTVSQLQQDKRDNPDPSGDLTDSQLINNSDSSSFPVTSESYLKMTKNELLRELQDKDTQISKLQEILYGSDHHSSGIEDNVDIPLSQEQCSEEFGSIAYGTFDEVELASTIRKFIAEYRAISASASVTVPHTNRLLDMLLDSIKLRTMSKHKLSPKELDNDIATIESSFVLKQLRMKDEEIARLKELLQERNFQLDQALRQSIKSQGASKGSGVAEHLNLESTPRSTQVQGNTFIGDKCELMLTNPHESTSKGMDNLGTVVLPDPSSANEAVLISFSARLKKVPIQEVKAYGDPIYKSNGLTIASRVTLGSSHKSAHQAANLYTSAGDLALQDLKL